MTLKYFLPFKFLKQQVLRFGFCAVVLPLPLTKNASAQPPGKGYQLLYEENFEKDSLEENDWKYRTGRRTGGNINGMNLKENVSVNHGLLHIAVKQEMMDGKLENTGGGVISKHQFGYGYYETRSKPFMAGTGVHSSFWQAGGSVPNNDIFEIDSYEIDSKHFMGCNNLYLHISPKGEAVPWVTRANVPFTFDKDGWFVDGYEYTPEGVIYYDNKKEVARAYWNELTAAQVVLLTGLNGVGKVDSTAFPGETVFDYFRYYAKDYPGINLLPNGSFEYNQDKIDPTTPVAWQQEGTQGAATIVEGYASKDRYKLLHGRSGGPYQVTTKQSLEYITNGEYLVTAMVRSSGGQKEAKIKVTGYGGKELYVVIPQSKTWTKVLIPRIAVSNNSVTIAIYSNASSGQWLEVDDIQFMKPAHEQKIAAQKPFVLIGDPIWEQAKKKAIEFTGDEKFYFFSRNVGFGDSITVTFSFTPTVNANTSPIARLPKTGNSGWAVLLNEKGDIIFRIGSAENHRDVVAANAYKAGQETALSCVLNKSTAHVYVNGKLLKTETGITQNTKDLTAAGRLGNVGEIYQAVGDVIVHTKPTHTVRPEIKGLKSVNYVGSIRNLQIFNRGLQEKEIEKLLATGTF